MIDGAPTILAFGMPGGWEWIIIALVALIIFGRKLPDVARSLGRSIVEFKKGIRDVNDDVDRQARNESAEHPRIDKASEKENAKSLEHSRDAD